MLYLTRKARFVPGGHLTDPPSEMTYRSVVSRDTSRILLKKIALNGIDARFFDIGNVYLNADTDDKVYFISEKGFGTEVEGTITVVVKVLYGLKSASASIHKHLPRKPRDGIGFQTCLANPYTWMNPDVKASDFKYYKYISTHVDSGMTINVECDKIVKRSEKSYTL